MTVKAHRWVMMIHVPVHVIRNEDGQIIWNMLSKKDPPSQIICYDCEQPMTYVFGTECTADIDLRMPLEYWQE